GGHLVKRYLAAVVAVLTVLALAPRAEAAATVMCAPTPVDAASNRQVITAANSLGYTLNGQGCTVVQQADILQLSQIGFSAGPPFGPNILTTTGVLSGTTSVQVGTLPAGTYIQHIIVNNTTANAVTGGINFGSTSGSNDIVGAMACGANCLVYPPD